MAHLSPATVAILIGAALVLPGNTQPREPVRVEMWKFDRLDRIGGHPTSLEGNPRVIETSLGPAVAFDGIDDALFVETHPLAGAPTFTWEAVFRPEGGAEAQRWFHLQESGSENRMLLELRMLQGRWTLDAYLHSGEGQETLIDRDKLHPVLAWYHVAAVYDGRQFRSYVNGVEQDAASVPYAPQGAGRASIGVRINRISYFKGSVHSARFTPRPIAPREFLEVTGPWKSVSFATDDGGVVHGDLYGSGNRGVVLVHGGRFNKASWAEQAYALMKSGFMVLAIDLRGYGLSRGPGDADVFSAPLHLDVRAAVRHLRTAGATTVAVVGASLGGDAAANAALEGGPQDVDRLVLLAATPSRPLTALKIPSLFIVARDDASGDGPRLPGIRARYEEAPQPKELVLLDGDAHAQFLFATEQRDRVMRDIVRFLTN